MTKNPLCSNTKVLIIDYFIKNEDLILIQKNNSDILEELIIDGSECSNELKDTNRMTQHEKVLNFHSLSFPKLKKLKIIHYDIKYIDFNDKYMPELEILEIFGCAIKKTNGKDKKKVTIIHKNKNKTYFHSLSLLKLKKLHLSNMILENTYQFIPSISKCLNLTDIYFHQLIGFYSITALFLYVPNIININITDVYDIKRIIIYCSNNTLTNVNTESCIHLEYIRFFENCFFKSLNTFKLMMEGIKDGINVEINQIQHWFDRMLLKTETNNDKVIEKKKNNLKKRNEYLYKDKLWAINQAVQYGWIEEKDDWDPENSYCHSILLEEYKNQIFHLEQEIIEKNIIKYHSEFTFLKKSRTYSVAHLETINQLNDEKIKNNFVTFNIYKENTKLNKLQLNVLNTKIPIDIINEFKKHSQIQDVIYGSEKDKLCQINSIDSNNHILNMLDENIILQNKKNDLNHDEFNESESSTDEQNKYLRLIDDLSQKNFLHEYNEEYKWSYLINNKNDENIKNEISSVNGNMYMDEPEPEIEKERFISEKEMIQLRNIRRNISEYSLDMKKKKKFDFKQKNINNTDEIKKRLLSKEAKKLYDMAATDPYLWEHLRKLLKNYNIDIPSLSV